ncbi:MAG: 6-bladed beta-propeller [Candidatus Aminicenantes bacterium]|nr:6-bladed beta-propeller [Candidatus Aminicenantes bacterium]
MTGLLSIIAIGSPLFLSNTIAQTIKIESGIRVVHNEKDQAKFGNLNIDLKLMQTIGDIDAENEGFAFNIPSDVVIDAGQNIYILDSGNHRIQKFDFKGEFIGTIGRKGQGPGEFDYPRSIDIDGDGNLLVCDSGLRKAIFLDSRGREKHSLRFPKETITQIRYLRSGDIAAGVYAQTRLEEKKNSLSKMMKFYTKDGALRTEFAESVDYGIGTSNLYGNLFQFALDKDENICLSFDFQNRIEKYSPEGTLLWKADRFLPFSTNIVEEGKIERDSKSVTISGARFNRCSLGIAVDKKGRIWVLTPTRLLKPEEMVGTAMSKGKGTGTMIKATGHRDVEVKDALKLEIFDSYGILRSEIPLDLYADTIRMIHDNLFLIDSLRKTKVYHYKIEEKTVSAPCPSPQP